MNSNLLERWSALDFWTGEMPWLRLTSYLILSTFVLGNIATHLRYRRGWLDGYTRKLCHFGHMAIATPLLAFLPPVQLLPAIGLGSVAVVLIYALGALSRHPLLYGMVAGSLRERDAPHARLFFFLPLIAGNVALVAAACVFPVNFVRVAFFTAAISDGVAEPVGLRFGRNNRFAVKDPLWRRTNTKSVAGSLAVLLTSCAIALIFFAAAGKTGPAAMAGGVAYAVAVTCLEALAPRGLDNMLLLFFGSFVILAIWGLIA